MQNRISHVILSLNGKNWSNSKAVMKKIMFITGSRGEWGYIRPILRLMNERDDVQYILVVTNMHLLPSYGNSYKEIENDGFKIHYKIHMSLDGYSHVTQAKSLGIFLNSLPDIIETEKPDWILLAGDRGEQLWGQLPVHILIHRLRIYRRGNYREILMA